MHLVKLKASAKELVSAAIEGKLPSGCGLGYMAHAYLAERFGSDAPKGFWIHNPSVEDLHILFYSRTDADSLNSRHDGEPVLSKPFPRLKPGASCEFETCVCPVRRTRKGTEKDAFLVHLDQKGKEDRETVYHKWLQERLPGANVLLCRLTSFHLNRVVRRKQGSDREPVKVVRPVAVLRGYLEVTSDTFNDQLFRGVGRNRTFGYGFLRVWPMR